MKRAANKEYNRGFAAGLRHAIIVALGGECSRCHKVRDPALLNVDHVHGGGNAHRRHVGTSGPKYYKALLRLIRARALRLLCANCDKKVEYLKRTRGRKTS
jgi:hypothetical protein